MSLLWKAREKKLMSDTFILKGCYKRKEVVHPLVDKAIVVQLANTHPWTVNVTPSLKLEYTRLYGQIEFDALMVKGKPNMVEAFEAAWVQNGTFVPADPKPVPVPPTDGAVSPYGTSGSAHAVIDLSKDSPDLEALIDKVMVSVLKRAGLWKEQS
jgi:hypothetical protein